MKCSECGQKVVEGKRSWIKKDGIWWHMHGIFWYQAVKDEN